MLELLPLHPEGPFVCGDESAGLQRFGLPEFEYQVGERERQLNEANLRRVRSVEKEGDEARCQVQNLRKELFTAHGGAGRHEGKNYVSTGNKCRN
jgi:hypothetical protein